MTDTPAGSPHYHAAIENRFAGDARFTEATLAVAYELRTANLITVLHAARKGLSDATPEHVEILLKLSQEIDARLDLA